MRYFRIIALAALPIIGTLATAAAAAPAGGDVATATIGAAWIGDNSERDSGPGRPGPTDPNGPAR